MLLPPKDEWQKEEEFHTTPSLPGGWLVSHEGKQHLVQDHFSNGMTSPCALETSLGRTY
jgi:hypothetical protein